MLLLVTRQAKNVLKFEFCYYQTCPSGEEVLNSISFPIIYLGIDHATVLFQCFYGTNLALVSDKVNEELQKYSENITGVPYFVVGDNNSQFMKQMFCTITQSGAFTPLVSLTD